MPHEKKEMKSLRRGKGKSFQRNTNNNQDSFPPRLFLSDNSWKMAGIAFWKIDENENIQFSNDLAGSLISKPGQKVFSFTDITALMPADQKQQFTKQIQSYNSKNEPTRSYHISVNLPNGIKHFQVLSFVTDDENDHLSERFGLVIDETQTQNLQQQLQYTHEFAKIGAFTFDCINLKYRGAPSLSKIFYHHNQAFDLTQDEFFKWIHPADLEHFKSTQNQCYDAGNDHYSLDFRMCPSVTGKYHHFRLTASISYTLSGIPIREQGLIIDQTEQKKKEESVNQRFEVLSNLSFDQTQPGNLSFFDHTLEKLSKALNADYVFLHEKSKNSVQQFVISKTFTPEELNQITLSDLQTNESIKKFIEDDTREIYLIGDAFYNPDTNTPFDLKNIKGYAVLKLRDSNQDIIGLISALSSDKIEDFELTFYILKAFGIRIASELERQKNQYSLQETIQSLRIAASCAQLSYWSYTPLADQFQFDFQNLDVLDQPRVDTQSISSKQWFSNIHPDDRKTFQNQIKNCLKKEKKRIDLTCRIFTRRKDWLWVKIQGESTLDNQQSVKQIIGYVDVIDSLKRAEQKASENANRLRLALTAGNMGTFDIDISSMTINVDETWQRIFNYKPPFNLLSDHDPIWQENVLSEDQPRIRQFFDELKNGKSGILAIEFRFSPSKNFQTDLKWFRLQTHIVERDLNQRPLRAIGFVQEVTKNKVSMDQLEWIANHDPLTGLPNERMIREYAAEHPEQDFTFFLINLGHVQQINELYTFQIGNEYLQEIINRIRFNVGDNGIIARLHGILFAIIMKNDKNLSLDPKQFAQKLFRELKQPVGLINTLQLSSSIKIGISSGIGKEYENLFQQAREAIQTINDNTLHKAPRSYVQVYSEQIQEEAENTLKIRDQLFDSVQNSKDWELKFLPIINAVEERLVGIEALVRWKHPEFKNIHPATFLPIAEENGLIIPLGDIILTQLAETYQWIRNQTSNSSEDFWLSTNVNPQQLLFGNYDKKIARILNQFKIDPARIVIEVNNSHFSYDPELTRSKLQSLKKLGVKLALDDFRNDFSALENLQQSLFDIIKIDQNVVKNLLYSLQSKAIATSALALGKSLGMNTITEGIETKEQFQLIMDMGGQSLQGYLFGKPLNREELMRLITKYAAKETADD